MATQAQIEAEICKLMIASSCFGRECCPLPPCACVRSIMDRIAALTAAAGVGESLRDMRTGKRLNERGWPIDDDDLPNAGDVKGILKPDWLHPYTIERCAQVVNELRRLTWDTNSKQALSEAVAAIRALKDQP